MRTSQLGRGLLGLGLAVGTIASVAWMAGFAPSRLPPVLLDIAAYKLTFLAAVGLIVTGAAVVRSARRGELQRSRDLASRSVNELSAGDAGPVSQQTAPEKVTNRRV